MRCRKSAFSGRLGALPPNKRDASVKKILPVAVLAAIHGVEAAKVVHVNRGGTGRVLVFPYYTVDHTRPSLLLKDRSELMKR